VIAEENLSARAASLGAHLTERLARVKDNVAQLAEVRGLGSMIAAEFIDPKTGRPDPAFTRQVQTRALERGLILLMCGVYGNVIRFLFPLTIEQKVLDEGLDILEEALTTCATTH
jgi:4-aminobutyrate aminotransferase